MDFYHYKHARDAVRQILKSEGILGLYRAYGATILAFGPYLGIQLSLYDKSKSLLGIESKNISTL